MFGLGDKVKNLKDKAKGKAIEKMMEKQMKNLPEEQKAALMGMFEKNPEFFENIAKEIEAEVKNGKNQMAAAMGVMRKHQAKMQQMMMESMGNPRANNRNLQ
jgi:hypothetical protein